MTLALWAERDSTEPVVRAQRLERALQTAKRAGTLEITWQSHHAQAWIFDSLMKWDEAIHNYEEARRLCNQETNAAAQRSSRIITYNLACTLSKAQRIDQAFDQLAKVIDADGNLQAATQDPDFAVLRADARFKQLIDGLRTPDASQA